MLIVLPSPITFYKEYWIILPQPKKNKRNILLTPERRCSLNTSKKHVVLVTQDPIQH